MYIIKNEIHTNKNFLTSMKRFQNETCFFIETETKIIIIIIKRRETKM